MADRDEGMRLIADQIISGVRAQKELIVLQAMLACLIDMMGGSVTLHDYEYEKYFTGDYKVEPYMLQDPRGIQLKVVKSE